MERPLTSVPPPGFPSLAQEDHPSLAAVCQMCHISPGSNGPVVLAAANSSSRPSAFRPSAMSPVSRMPAGDPAEVQLVQGPPGVVCHRCIATPSVSRTPKISSRPSVLAATVDASTGVVGGTEAGSGCQALQEPFATVCTRCQL